MISFKKPIKSVLTLASILSLSVIGTSTVLAQDAADYPTRPIQVIVPVGPGGDTDLNTRVTAKYLEKELGKTLVVSNIKGAGGSIGLKQMLSNKPDGYSVAAYHNAMLVNNIYGLAEYTYEDFKFAGVAILDQSNTFLASAKAPFQDIESFIEYAKENPGKVKVATETGAMTHLQLLEFVEKTGVDVNIVDAGGAAEKITALLGGRVDIVPTSLGLVQDYVKSGDIISLGVIAEERLEGAPDVKTFKEQGVDMTADKVFFWAFSPDVPDAIVDKFSQAMEKVVNNPDFQKDLAKNLLTPIYLDQAATNAKLKELFETGKKVFDDAKK